MGDNDFKHYNVGLHNVGSYQTSGWPWITGSTGHAANSEIKYEFPSVAKAVTVINKTAGANAQIRVHFAAAAAGNPITGLHYVSLDSDEDKIVLNVKCKEVYITAPNNGSARSYEIIAEMTNINADRMYILTGSGVTD
jgi:hypothetical protein